MHAHVRGIIYIFNYEVYLYIKKSFKSTASKQNETMKKENEEKSSFYINTYLEQVRKGWMIEI